MDLFTELNIINELCFDVGANVGIKTEKFLKLGAKVVCIEPQTYCISKLEAKFSNNNNVKIINTALGSSERIDTMFISDQHTLSTMSNIFIEETGKERFKNTIWGKKETVNVYTLDKIIKLYGLPKYCKIDVEGYELEILKGLSIPIQFISIEFVPELKQTTFECIKLLNNIGNYKYNYIEGESEIFSFNEWVEHDIIIEFLKKNNDYAISFGDLYAKLI